MLQETTINSEVVVLACSVHGLRDSRSEGEWKKRGLEGEVGGTGTAAMKEPRKSWLSSLNTVVGDRQESIVLENAEQRRAFASTAAMVAGTGAVAGAVAASATWTPPPPLSLGTPRRPPSPSVGIAPSTRSSATSAALTVLYQSEHRSLGQRSIAPTGSATSWSQAPGVASSSGGSAAGDGWDDGDGLSATMAEEGVVHFSLPARVSRGVEGGQMEEKEGGAGMFTVALWQVFNRSRRVLVGSVTPLLWRDFSSVPNDSRKFRVFPGFQSERYPSAFLVVRRLPLGRSVPRPLSMSPTGVANPVLGKFNPIITYFTTLRRAAVASGPNALKDVATLRPAFSGDRHASVTSSHGENGKGSISDAVAAAGRWELVVCQELAVESKLTFKVPLQFLSPVHNALKRAALAWRRRVLEERNRQGVFDTEEKAFANGRVLVRVSVSRARGLDAIAAGAAAAAVEAAEASTRGGLDDLDVDNRQTSDPFVLPPAARGAASGGRSVSERFSPLDGRLAGLGGGIEEDGSDSGMARGAGRGIGLGLGGIDRRRVSTSMRMLGGRMRGMGVRAVTMAKNASQASPTAHLRLGAASVHQKMLRQANFFVKVMYEPPPSPSPSSSFPSEEAFLYGGDGSIDVPYAPAPEKVVGLTNTEYGSVEPVWGTNVNRNACPYNQPRLHHQVSGATRLEVVSNPTGGGGDGGKGREGQGAEVTGPRPDALAFSFYVAAKDVQTNNKPGGRLRLHLCQAGIADVPVGVVTIPLAENASSDRTDSVRRPRWREVESYDGSAVPAWSDIGEDFGGGLLGQQASPQVLVGVSIQSRGATSSRPGSPRRQPLPVKASYSAVPIGSGGDQPSDAGSGALGLGQVALGRIGLVALRLRGIGNGGISATTAGETAGAAATEFEIDDSRDLGGDWTKVGEDSDTDEEGPGGQTPAAATAASTTIITPNDFVETLVETAEVLQHSTAPPPPPPSRTAEERESISLGEREEAVVMRDCYRWMDSIGGPSPVLDTQALLELFSTIEYPVEWIEAHWRRVAGQRDRLVRILDLYSQRLAEGANFRSSLLKKDPLLQYVATNLHIQVWSISDPSTGKTRSYDMITTGAPAAHVIGFAAGGLVTLQAALQRLGTKVLGLKAACRECAQMGEPNRIMNQEPNIDRLRVALLEYELLSSAVAMRRVCVVSQAVTIAATSFCTKLEMMVRGTLEIGRDLSSGGCADFDDLAKRWTTTGFLLGFEGLLSIHGKELGMVEDTVCALDMLADYQLQVVPANPDNPLLDLPDLAQLRVGDDAGGEFELEVGLEERTIKCIVGGASLKRLPRVLWGRGVAGSGGAGSAVVRIVPVLFTQGIDIQQSMSHASSSAKEKAAFQAEINSTNLARLNRYCHRVCPVSRPAHSRSANPGPVLGSAVGFEGTDGGGDLLHLGDFGEGMAGLAGDEKAARSTRSYRAAETFPQLSHRISPGGSVPDWIHPVLSDLEAAVRDERINHKNTAILLEAQLAVRGLCGGRVTFCKSGKDRTAMSVTLEEALLLAEHTSSQGNPPRDAGDTGAAGAGCGWRAADRSGALANANVLRAHGCRLMVAEKNIGYPLYSFNSLQRQFIPELYQPPLQTIQDVITSALNRDS